MKYEAKKTAVYHNNRVYHPTALSPDGVSPKLMFMTNRKKINFYLNNNLANVINERPDGTVDIILTFIPKGLGCNSEFDLAEKSNVCVISGDSIDLTQHHVVPSMYGKFFPWERKQNNSHDVVLLTVPNHVKYEREASLYKDVLAKQYGAPTLHEFITGQGWDSGRVKEDMRKSKLAYTLLNYEDRMPPKRQQELRREFLMLTDLEPTDENYKKISKLGHTFKLQMQYGELFVPLITDIEEFCVNWRKHFIETANPQFLPKGWSIYGNRRNKN